MNMLRQAQEGVRREALHRLELLGQGVERPVRKPVAVDQEDVALLGGRVVEVQVLRLGLLDGRHHEKRIRGDGRPSEAAIGFAREMAAPNPSASYSLTIRVEIPAVPGSFAKVAAAIGEADGDLGAIDLVRVTRESRVRDVTVSASDSDHGQRIVDAVRERARRRPS